MARVYASLVGAWRLLGSNKWHDYLTIVTVTNNPGKDIPSGLMSEGGSGLKMNVCRKTHKKYPVEHKKERVESIKRRDTSDGEKGAESPFANFL